MKMTSQSFDRLTRAQLQQLLPCGMRTYLQRMWHNSDGVHPIVTMKRRSGMMMELHTMDDAHTFMMTTSGKRSRVSVHDLDDACHALKNWVSNSSLHGSIQVAYQDAQHSWEPTKEDLREILNDFAFNMPLDSWQESFLQKHGHLFADEVGAMVTEGAAIEMIQRIDVMRKEWKQTTDKPESYGISMKHGHHGLVINSVARILDDLTKALQTQIKPLQG